MADNDEAVQGVDHRAKTKEEMVAESEKRQSARPTPTQREADLMRVGAFNPDDRDDTSGPDDTVERTMAGHVPGGNAYETRAAAPAGERRAVPRPQPQPGGQAAPHKRGE